MRTKEVAATREHDNGLDGGEETAGTVEVSLNAIATVASKAALICYGVVGTTPTRGKDDRVRVLDEENAAQGIEVRYCDNTLVIDVHVVIEYGIRIFEVAHTILDTVTFAVRRALDGVPVRVNVHVEALRVSDPLA